jgi:two-component system chemotaxis response regulator CheY
MRLSDVGFKVSPEAVEENREIQPDQEGAAMRALIVDDNEDMRSLVSLTMQLAGIDVAGEAADACGGVRGWRAQQPDVVILDYRLPDHSGLDAAAYILREDPSARIVLFSAYLDDAALARAADLGVRAIGKDRVRDLPTLVGGIAA